jgi:broad-specificity NMP kinase
MGLEIYKKIRKRVDDERRVLDESRAKVADLCMDELVEAEEREKSSSDSESSTKSLHEIPEDVRRILPLIPPKPKAYTDKAGIVHKPSEAEISAYHDKWSPYLKYMRMYKKEKKGK